MYKADRLLQRSGVSTFVTCFATFVSGERLIIVTQLRAHLKPFGSYVNTSPQGLTGLSIGPPLMSRDASLLGGYASDRCKIAGEVTQMFDVNSVDFFTKMSK